MEAVISAKETAVPLEIEPVFLQKIIRKQKRVFLYESSGEVQSSPEETFEREVCYPLVDNLSSSLKKRSSVLNKHHQKGRFLSNVAITTVRDVGTTILYRSRKTFDW